MRLKPGSPAETALFSRRENLGLRPRHFLPHNQNPCHSEWITPTSVIPSEARQRGAEEPPHFRMPVEMITSLERPRQRGQNAPKQK
jgi:hypothetical protein